VSTIFGLVSQVIQKQFGHYYAQSWYWPPLLGREIDARSLPHHEHGRQRSVNDFWPFIMGNRDASVIVYIGCSDSFSMLKRSGTLRCIILYEISCYCPGGCRGNVACLSAERGCQFLCNRRLQSCATWITQAARP